MALSDDIRTYQDVVAQARTLDHMAAALATLAKSIVAAGLPDASVEEAIETACGGHAAMTHFLRQEVAIVAARPHQVAVAKLAIEALIIRMSAQGAYMSSEFSTMVTELPDHIRVIDPTISDTRDYIIRASGGIVAADARITEKVVQLLRYG